MPTNGSLSVSNGVVLTSGSTVKKGDAFTITATPAPGYSLASLTVNDVEFTNQQNFTVNSEGEIFIVAKMEETTEISLIKENTLSVYPNPVKNLLNITGFSLDNAKIDIYSITGILVKTLETKEQDQKINVSLLPQGIYVLRYTKDNVIKTCRFTKE